MQAWRHGPDRMESMLPQRVRLVAPQNVIFHSMGQLAPPTLVINPHMHRHWCTHPKGPKAMVNPMQEGCHIHPKRGAQVPLQEPKGIQTVVRVLPQRQVDRVVRPYRVLIIVLLLFLRGLAHQVLQESHPPIFETGFLGHPFHPTPVPNNLCIILNKDIGQRPLSEVREGDPQRDGCNNVPRRIFDIHCHFLGPSVGHDALKVKQLVSTAR